MNPSAVARTFGLLATLVVATSRPLTAQIVAPERRLVPELTIDGAIEDWTTLGFFLVGRDGRMIVAQPRDYHVRAYAADGKLLYRFGREGSGPGEFAVRTGMRPAQTIIRGSWLGDTLVVYDDMTRRFTLIAPTGKLVRTVPLPSALRSMSGEGASISAKPERQLISVQPFGLLSSGFLGQATYGVVSEVTLSNGEKSKRTTTDARDIVALGRDGALRTRIGAVIEDSVRALVIRTRENGALSSWGRGIPFHVAPAVVFAPQGDRVVIPVHESQHTANGVLRITTLSVRGDTLGRARIAYRAEPIPKTVSDSVLKAMRPSASATQGTPPDVLDELDRLVVRQVPKFYAAASSVAVAPDGMLWLRGRTEANGVRVVAVEPDGRSVMSVRLPPGYGFMTGTRTHIWATSYDADDLPRITRFRVVNQ
jgi:hypothetical protein